MRSIRRLLPAVLCVTLLAAACAKVPTRSIGGSGESAQTPVAATTIRVLTTAYDPALDALISAYYAKYPDDRIQKVIAQSHSGVSPEELTKQRITAGDVDVVSTLNVPDLAKQNQLLALDPFIQKSNLDLKPFGPGLDGLRIGGKLYDLPYVIQPYVLVYNKDLFQAMGVPAPQPGWTWEQFRDTARKLTRGDGKVWGFAPSVPMRVVPMFLLQKGEYSIAAYQDEAAVKELLAFFGTMVQSDKSMPPAEQWDPSSPEPVRTRNDFRMGKAAMSIEILANLWSLGAGGAAAKFTTDVASIPAASGSRSAGAQAGPQTYAITAASRQPEAAWKFIRFATGPEGAAVVARSGLLPPYMTLEVKKAWFDRQPAPPPGTESLFNTTWSFAHTPTVDAVSPAEQKIETAVFTAMNRTLSGERRWDEAFVDYQREAAQARAEEKK